MAFTGDSPLFGDQVGEGPADEEQVQEGMTEPDRSSDIQQLEDKSPSFEVRELSVEIRMLEDEIPQADKREIRARLWLLLGASPPLMILMAAAMFEGMFWLLTALMVLVPCWMTVKWFRAARETRHLRSQLRALDAELAAALERSPDDDPPPTDKG